MGHVKGHFNVEKLTNEKTKGIIVQYFKGIDGLMSINAEYVMNGENKVTYAAVVGFVETPGHLFNVVIGKVGEFYWWAFYDTNGLAKGCFHKEKQNCVLHFQSIFDLMLNESNGKTELALPKLNPESFPKASENPMQHPVSPTSPKFLISVSDWSERMLNTADP
eukprot:Nk52_evm1s1403 gene=Nk52_evmTU1s1403